MKIIRGFLTPQDRIRLWAFADQTSFGPGRQGTGYEKSPLPEGTYDELRHSALDHLVAPHDLGHDCYVMRYTTGACIPLHRDDAPLAAEHHRINALIQKPGSGGELYVGGQLVELEEGDAYIFRPDVEEHEVKLVTSGTRLLFTLGILK